MWTRSTFLLPFALLLFSCDERHTGTGQESEEAQPADDLAQGLASLEERLLDAPQKTALYVERARLYERFDSLNAAERDWKRAITIDSSDVELQLGLGDLHYRRVDLDKARRRFEKALELEPNSNKATLRLAELELVQRRYPRAMELANEALRRDPLEAKGYFIKGWIHKEIGDTAMAISSLRTAIEQDPDHYDAFLQLGLLHAAVGDRLAIQYLNSALEIEPQSGEALYAKGLFHQQVGDDSLAMETYTQLKEADTMDARPWFNSGFMLLEYLDDPEAAITEFDQAIERFPTYYQAYYNRGLAKERMSMLDSAALDYRRALVLKPEMDLAAEGLQRLQDLGVRVRP